MTQPIQSYPIFVDISNYRLFGPVFCFLGGVVMRYNDKMNTLEIQTSKSQRFSIIDVAKGIGILFVVFAHVNFTPELLTYIYSFHMPLFFILSGMVFNGEKYNTFFAFFKRKFYTLICPYFFYYILAMVIKFVIDIFVSGISSELFKDYGLYFVQMFLAQNSSVVVNDPLWFVPCLFVAEMLYYFLSKLEPTRRILVCVLISAMGWFLESGILPWNCSYIPWSIDTAMFAVTFFAIGHVFSSSVRKFFSMLKNCRFELVILVSILVACLLMLLPICAINGKISLGSKILNNGFLVYLSGMIGTVGILCASACLTNNRFLLYCGRNSLFIMAIHTLIRGIYTGGCSLLGIGVYDNTKLTETLIPFGVVLVTTLILAQIYNKMKIYAGSFKKTN